MKVLASAEAVLQEGIAARAFPGAAYAMLHRGKLTTGAAGRFTYEAEAPTVGPETIYDLASVTKVAATTAMAMLLHDRGRLALDLPVAQLVPEFAEVCDSAKTSWRAKVTLRMLLQHTSGLPAYARLFERSRGKEAVLRAACALPLEVPPGNRSTYSDIGFIILGIALERAAGESLDVFCRRELFGPLAMTATRFCPLPEMRTSIPPTEDDRRWRDRVIQGEVNDENASAMGGIAGHAGLFGTAGDLVRLAACLLEGGKRLLRSETVALFTRRCSPEVGSYALGWDTPSAPSQSGQYFSPAAYGHLGFTGTSLWIDPEHELAVALLTNRTWPDQQSQLIKKFRPRFYDAVIEGLR